MRRRRRRGRGIPTAALVAGVVVALGASAWLFIAQGSDDSDAKREHNQTEAGEQKDQADSVLELPKDDTPSGDRLDPDAVRNGSRGEDDDANEDDAGVDADGGASPALLQHLRGTRVALANAAAAGAGDEDRILRIGATRVACAAATDPVRARAQEQLTAELARQLAAAGATVTRADDRPSCVDARSTSLAKAEYGIVVGDADARRVLPATGANANAAPTPGSRSLANEIAGWLGLDGSTIAATSAARQHVASVAAITTTNAASIALVEVSSSDLQATAAKETAASIVAAIASAATHAIAPQPRPTDGARP